MIHVLAPGPHLELVFNIILSLYSFRYIKSQPSPQVCIRRARPFSRRQEIRYERVTLKIGGQNTREEYSVDQRGRGRRETECLIDDRCAADNETSMDGLCGRLHIVDIQSGLEIINERRRCTRGNTSSGAC
jgi:hypothetical protein